MTDHGDCTTCGRTLRLTRAGRIWAHLIPRALSPAVRTPCTGAGLPPAPAKADRLPRDPSNLAALIRETRQGAPSGGADPVAALREQLVEQEGRGAADALWAAARTHHDRTCADCQSAP